MAVQMDLLDHALRLVWMLILTVWLALASESSEPVEAKRDWGSTIAVWVVSIAWLILLLPRSNGPQLIPRLPFIRVVGFAAALVGLLFGLWARIYLGRSWDAFISLKQNHKLLQSGPYSIVRHPIYAGFMLALIGSALTFGHLRSFVATALVVVAWVYKSGLEEMFLIDHFGAEYEEYRHRVKRLIPYVW
jgi:protein-S-isoprenylcysteine O-methyltransferase Ste14